MVFSMVPSGIVTAHAEETEHSAAYNTVASKIDELLVKYLGTTEHLDEDTIGQILMASGEVNARAAQADVDALVNSPEAIVLTADEVSAMKEEKHQFVHFVEVLDQLFPEATAVAGNLTLSSEGLTAAYSGDVDWTGNGTSASVSVTSSSSTQCGGTSYTKKSATLTLTNGLETTAILSFTASVGGSGTVTINGAAASSGDCSYILNGGTSCTIVVTSAEDTNATTASLTNISLVAYQASNVTFQFDAAKVTSVTVAGNAIESGAAVSCPAEGLAVSVVPAEGVTFLGWQDADGNVYANNTTLSFTADTTLTAVFSGGGATDGAFAVGSSYFDDLNEAAAMAASTGDTIVLNKDHTLPAGEYTIPKGVKLLIPYNDANTANFEGATTQSSADAAITTPSVYRELRMENATIICYGSINVNAVQVARSQRDTGAVTGPYGAIYLDSGSAIRMESGSNLYAYGYIGGEGMVEGKSGSKIYQMFQIMDWRGGSASSSLLDKLEGGAFLVSQYYIQNIESTLRINAGCTMTGVASLAAGLGSAKSPYQSTAVIVGQSEGMFRLSSGYADLKYNASNDRMELDFYGSLATTAITMKIKLMIIEENINSAEYILGIPSNYTIRINSGSTLSFDQKFRLLPGCKIYVASGAGATVESTGAVYLYDADDWNGGSYSYQSNMYQLPYVYSRKGAPVTRTITENAILEVNGSLSAYGPIYSTKNVANGGDAGITGSGTLYYEKIDTSKTSITEGSNLDQTANVTVVPALGTIAGHEGMNSFAVGTYKSVNGVWYQHVITGSGFGQVEGAYAGTGSNIAYVGATKETAVSDMTVTLTPTADKCANSAKVDSGATGTVADGKLVITNITGDVTVSAGTHTPDETKWYNDGTYHFRKCAACQADLMDGKQPCSGGTASCNTLAVCGTCGLGHGKLNADNHENLQILPSRETSCSAEGLSQGEKCTACGVITIPQKVTEKLPHTPGDAVNETDNAKCDKGNHGPSTCTVKGGYDSVVYCTVCKEEISRDHNSYELIDHDYSVVVNAQAPTCTEAGWKAHTKCSACDQLRGYEEIAPTGHDPYTAFDGTHHWTACRSCDYTADKAEHSGGTASCTAAPVCTGCQQSYGTALGHDFESSTEFVSVEGGHKAVCAREGCSVQSDAVTAHSGGTASCTELAKCERCGAAYGQLLEHTVVTLEGKEPTCTESGLTEGQKCSVCDKTLKEQTVLEALDHSRATIPAVAASCTKAGILGNGIQCSRCQEILEASTVDPALGHDFKSEVTRAPTCTDAGVKTYTCQRANCDEGSDANSHGKIWTESISELGHDFLNYRVVPAQEPTCTEDGWEMYTICARCEEENPGYPKYTIPAGHDWDFDHWTGNGTGHWHECQREGCPITDVTENNGYTACVAEEDDGSCLSAVKCTVCMSVMIPAQTEHTLSDWAQVEGTATHERHCLVGGCSAGDEVKSCQGGTATCTAQATCADCGQPYGGMLEHSYTSGVFQKNANGHSQKCVSCEAYGPEQGHDFGDWITDAPADCENDGTKHRVCGVCQYKETGTIHKSGHAWFDAWTSGEGHHWHECGNAKCPVTADAEKDGYDVCTPGTNDGNCANNILCTVCSAVTASGKDHVYAETPVSSGEGTGRHTYSCVNCDQVKEEACSGGQASCTSLAACDQCSAEYGKLAAHVWEETWTSGGSKHWHKCSNPACSEINAEAECAGGAATCTQAATCDTCKNAYGQALGHQMSYFAAQAPNCTDAGNVEYWHCDRCQKNFSDAEGTAQMTTSPVLNAAGHKDVDKDYACDVCGTDLCTDHAPVAIPAIPATCEKGGMSEGSKCGKCGDILEEPQPVAALGHSYTSYVYNEDANCTTDGTETASCDNGCQVPDTRVKTGSALGHDFENSTEYAVTATGHSKKCTRCTVTDQEAAHTGGEASCTAQAVCSVCNSAYGSMVDHVFTVYESSDTLHWRKCANCTATQTAEEHVFGEWTSNGDNTHTRSCVCDKTETADCSGGTATCTEAAICVTCKSAYGQAMGHDWSEKWTGDGKNHWHECGNDNCPVTENADKNGYTACVPGGNGGDCTNNILCTVCSAVTASGKDHVYAEIPVTSGEGTGRHTYSCVNCEQVKEEACFGGEASCTNLAVCEKCFAEYGELAAHVWETGWISDGSKHWHKCSNGDCAEINAVAECAGGSASCTQAATCATCKNTYGQVLGHEWSEEWTYVQETSNRTHWHACTRCDAKKGEASHTPVAGPSKAPTCTEDGYTAALSCSVCGKVMLASVVQPATGHTAKEPVKENVVDATCTAKGSYDLVTYCQNCDKVMATEHVETDALGHLNDILLSEVKSTCTETGLTEGKKCSRCEQVTVPQVTIPSKGHKPAETVTGDRAATCTEAGYTGDIQCTVCHEITTKGQVIDALGHTEVIDEAKKPTCTETGLTEGSHCSVCGDILVKQETVKENGHTEVTDESKAPTCTDTGLTEGSHCSVCGDILVKQEVVKATGHSLVNVPGKPATCTEPGYTASLVCSVCGHEEVAAEEISAKGHTPAAAVKENVKNPTCTEGGSYEDVVYCVTCGGEQSRTPGTTPPNGHQDGDVRKENEIKATCTEAGSHDNVTYCAVCKQVAKTQHIVVKATGHTEVEIPAQAPTCTKEGYTAGTRCSVCGEVVKAPASVAKLPHTPETIPAVAPTCVKEGTTEGKKCSVCQEILEAPEAVETVEHQWGVGRITTAPTCTEEGVRTFTCSMCRDTKTAAEPANGHDLETVPAKKPTYTEDGWEAYERCTAEECFYTTRVLIPALGEPTIETYEDFIENLSILESIADNYVKKVSPGKDAASMIIKYIRTGVERYNSGSWNIMAGYEDKDFADYVAKYEADYNLALADGEPMMKVTGLKNLENMVLPSGDEADVGHIFGLMDISYTNISNANVSGWAGDIVDLLSASDQYGISSTTVEDMVSEIKEKYFGKTGEDLLAIYGADPDEGSFSHTDARGDLDGYYFMQTLLASEYEDQELTEMISSYMTPALTDRQRAAYFLRNKLNGVTLRSEIREAIFNEYSGDKAVATLEGTRVFKAPTDKLMNMRRAVCYVFADYLWKLAGDYVEDMGDQYLTVFDTKVSNLAPGVTQKIFSATTNDNQTVVYYVATADVTREDVHVYANYNNNDPGQGWAMQRVLEQAQAAQENYSNPDHPKYTENFNVVAAINGNGYDMYTGKPSGLLVMEGVEWKEANKNVDFFAILDDGSAIVGTYEEYLQLKAAGRLKEAIGAFASTTLIKDGRIPEDITNTKDRMGRTAVGVTASGKVVFLAVDGRQIGLSCGASTAEMAQIMLDAGCYDAILLDGGGSTTYVAKPEGESELQVVSNPSDGAPRSVADSLFIASTAPSSTAFDRAVVDSTYTYLTVGATAQLSARGVSATGNPVEIPEGAVWTVDSSAIGAIDETGLFTAKADGTVTVQLKLEDQVIGTKKLYVVVPDNIYFAKDKLSAIYGEPLVLPVRAVYEGKQVSITEADVTLSVETPKDSMLPVGSVEGFTFTGDEASGIRSTQVFATLVKNSDIKARITLNLFSKDEASFDFDSVTGGDRQFAFNREVSNATEAAANTYRVVDPEEPMVTTYTFAMDMSQIPVPAKLQDLTYMLPGADMEDASAWNFLLQLAERVSVLTNVTPTLVFDKNFDVDYSELTVSNEYFVLDSEKGIIFDEATNTLSLRLNWVDQETAIDASTANPLCIVSGIKLTPKADADWGSSEMLKAVNLGEISYDMYLRANALYTFALKPENQQVYNLYPFENPDVIISGATEKGGRFSEVYTTFQDSYSLIKGNKEGWSMEDGGWAYYVDGQRLKGFASINGLYYDFGETGINIGQKVHTGAMVIDGKEYYVIDGKMFFGWQVIDIYNVNYYNETTGVKEKLEKDEIPSTCLVDGSCTFTSESGATKFVRYDDAGGHDYKLQADGTRVCADCGYIRVDLSEKNVKLSAYAFTYNGKAWTPATTVTGHAGEILTKPPANNYDYSTEYRNNVEVGTATATVTAMKYGMYGNLNDWFGNAAGSVTIAYEIRPDLPTTITVRAVEGSEDKAIMTWTAAMASGVTYVLYKSTDEVNWTEFATTTSLSYELDGKALAGHAVRLGTRKVVDGKTYNSINMSRSQYVAPLVSASNHPTSGKPMLTWSDLVGSPTHYVYRSTSPNGPFEKVNFSTQALTYQHVSAKIDTRYYYKVIAVYEDGQSLFSQVVSAIGRCTAPVVSIAASSSGHPSLSWNAVDQAENYQILRSEDGENFTVIGETSDIRYTDATASPRKDYSYKVAAVSRGGNQGIHSNVVALEPAVVFTQASVSLAGDIGLNYYVKLREDIASDPSTYLEFTFDGNTQKVMLSEAQKQSNGAYRFSCKLAARNMADAVTAQVYTNAGAVGDSKSFSVRDYCTGVVKAYSGNASYAALVDLLSAMLNYGAQSQLSLNHNPGDLANKLLSVEDQLLPDITAADVSGYAPLFTGSEDGIKIHSASLLLKTTTTVRCYIQLTGSKTIDQYTVKVNGKTVTPVKSGAYYYVDLVGIEARNLDTVYTFQVGGITMSYSGMSYVYSVMNQASSTQEAKDMAKALYGYAMAANAYFDK